ncbi:DUF4129 domain-containing protein [Fodinicola acaciae]|uniref:DUF4129 domain-containing protein n=1 Tax=Fodinicola acaciae TaxID=2681555 RepID=UPI0013D3FDEB|nr:DUF4129 domain-containing protein [Fodinicola acaciae]
MNNGWLRVAVAAIVLAVVAAGVNALSHQTLTTEGPLPSVLSLGLMVAGAVELVAVGVVVAGLIWLINPRLGGRQTRRHAAVLMAMVCLVIVVAVLARWTRPLQEPHNQPSAKVPPGVRGGSSEPVALAPDSAAVVLLVVAVVALAVIAVLFMLSRLRRRTTAVAPVSPAVPPLADAARLGRDAVLAGDTSPRAAIIRCFAAMEDALTGRGEVSPRASDTPVEVLERAWRRGLIRPEPAGVLLNLFAVARFSDHPMEEDDRAAAAAALSDLLDDLRERTP